MENRRGKELLARVLVDDGSIYPVVESQILWSGHGDGAERVEELSQDLKALKEACKDPEKSIREYLDFHLGELRGSSIDAYNEDITRYINANAPNQEHDRYDEHIAEQMSAHLHIPHGMTDYKAFLLSDGALSNEQNAFMLAEKTKEMKISSQVECLLDHTADHKKGIEFSAVMVNMINTARNKKYSPCVLDNVQSFCDAIDPSPATRNLRTLGHHIVDSIKERERAMILEEGLEHKREASLDQSRETGKAFSRSNPIIMGRN